jgi:5-methylcytosine-specific restriction endonuclease McrA
MSHQSARLRNGNDRTWRKIRERTLARDGYLCQYCGDTATTVDHIVPVTKGGTDEDFNLTSACNQCNSRKGNRMSPFFGTALKPLTLPLMFSPPNESNSHD